MWIAQALKKIEGRLSSKKHKIFSSFFTEKGADSDTDGVNVELTETENIYVEKSSLVYQKVKRKKCSFCFDHFMYMAFLQKMKNLLPFALNPTPRQFDLLLKFQKKLVNCSSLRKADFLYPCMTKQMTTLMKSACEGTDFSRTEMFIQKHFLGINLAYLEVFCDLEKLTPSP